MKPSIVSARNFGQDVRCGLAARSTHDEEPDKCKSEGKSESVGEAFDPHGGFSALTNSPTYQAHDEPSDYWTDQQAYSVQLRWMHQRMRENKDAQKAECEAKDSEFQNRKRRIRSTESTAKKWRKTEMTTPPRYAGTTFATGCSRCDCNCSFEDKLDQNFKKEFEDEAKQFFHRRFQAPLALRKDEGIRSRRLSNLGKIGSITRGRATLPEVSCRDFVVER